MAKQKEAEQTLPKVIYVYHEIDGQENYLIADEDRANMADTEARIVGKYQLVETGELVQRASYKRKRFAR